MNRRTILCLPVLLALSCGPRAREIVVKVPDMCREGTSVAIQAQVLDTKGGAMQVPIQWSVEPATVGAVEQGKIKCLAEGLATVSATVGDLHVSRKVTVTSPLVATWLRTGDDLAGMRLRIAVAGEAGLAGYIVGSPDDRALAGLKARNPSASDEEVEQQLACVAHVWAPGLKKWDKIRRLDQTRWSLEDLSKDFRQGLCRENVAKAQYLDNYELTLLNPERLEIRNLKQAGVPQAWQVVPDIDAHVIAANRLGCQKAIEVAQAGYGAALPAILELQKGVNDRFWAGDGSLVEFKTLGLLVQTLTSAQTALQVGAYKARQEAARVPASEEPGVTGAVRASQEMFHACKDVSP